jgi:CMP-N-acetylneuraminate monooxygenase
MINFLENFNFLPLSYKAYQSEVKKNIDQIQEGKSQDENFLYFRCGEKIKIYDRVCDHNGGRLSLKEDGAICPLHGWRLDLSSGFYTNVSCSKKPILEINDYELDSPLIFIPITKHRISPQPWDSEKTTEIRFINHACLLIKIGDITFATDPWIYGSAFCNGWWLAKSSPTDAFDCLNACDFIYISHNHPDHLHPESLQRIRKDIPILTADFQSGSTKEYLHKLGFINVVALDFASSLVNREKEIQLSVLKSGDFRDDSGLFFQIGKFKCLLTVDSNFLNFGKLPTVDLLCSSFAGGASGFPLCFENYSEEEKKIIVTRNRGAIKATNKSTIEIVEPSFFMPYAGFFTEAAKRDSYIKQRNIKNSVEDFESISASAGSTLLNVNKDQIFVFQGSQLVSQRQDETEKMDSTSLGVIAEFDFTQVDDKLNDLVIEYFEGCDFKDELLVDLRPTSDDFRSGNLGFRLDFSSNEYSKFDCSSLVESIEDQATKRGLRYLQIKVRRAELLDVLLNGKPWEDLSIGFQCRIYRMPNVYNSEFWFYFTNVYIGDKVHRSTAMRLKELDLRQSEEAKQ